MPPELWKHGWACYAGVPNTITQKMGEHTCEGGDPIKLNHYTEEDIDWVAEEVRASLETLFAMTGWKWDVI